MKKNFFLFTDYVNYRGGMWNLTRCRIVMSGYCDGYIKMFTSEVLTKEQLEAKAKRWAKKNNIELV